MGFRINRGIFQYKDTASNTFINKFKIDDRGDMIEVDPDGNKITTYMRLGDKSHDADLLDGIDSGGYVQTSGNQTITGTKRFSNSSIVIEGSHASISFIDNTSSADDFYLHANSNNFYVLSDRDGSNTVDGNYDAPHPMQLESDTNRAYFFGNMLDTAAYQPSSAFETAGASAIVNLRIEEEILPAIDTKLDAGATAVNADTVDGYHATNAAGGIPVLNSSNAYWYAPSWIHVNEGSGIFSGANGAHLLPNNTGQYGSWRMIGTRNGWEGLHFGDANGVTLMMNAGESGVHKNGTGWKYRHQAGKFYVYTGTNGGGTGYPVWHSGNLTPISYSTGSFFVGGDTETYYPVLLNKSSRTTGRFVIYRDNVHQDENSRGSGRLVLTGFTSGWGHVPLRLHYETKRSGGQLWKFLASNYRTGLMVVYLKGATTYYYKSEHGFTLHDANGQGDAKSDGRTTWLPTNQGESTALWEGETPTVNTIEDEVSYYQGYLKATGFKGDGANLTNVDAQTLDGLDGSQFLRSDTNDTMGGNLTLRYSTANSDDYNALTFAAGSNDYIIKASTSRGVFGRKSFGWHVDNTSAFGVYSNGWAKLFGVEGATGNIYVKGQISTDSYGTAENWKQAFDWGNHAGLYDTAGAAEAVRTDLTTLITTATDTADNAASTASTANTAATNAANAAAEAQTTADEATTLARAAQTTADSKLGSTEKATNSHAADGVNIVGYGNNEFSFYQSSGTFAGHTGWANYFIGNHGSGSSYYNTTHIMPFWGPPQYSRLESGTLRGPYTYWTTENLNPSDYSNASNLSSGTVPYDRTNRVLPTSGNYVWAAATTAGSYDTGVQTSFVRGADGWPHYGAVLHVGARGGGDAGGDFQLYCGHGSASGGNHLRFRNSDNSASPTDSWTDWKTILDSSNFTSYAEPAGRIDNEILPQVTTNTTNIARNLTSIDGKAAVSGSYGQNFYVNALYYDDWVRNHSNNNGMYWSNTGWHLYPKSSTDFYVRSGNNSECALQMYTGNAARTYVYADSSNNIGFLTASRSWALRVDNSKNTQIYNNLTVNGGVTAASFSGSLDWANVTNKPTIPAATAPIQALVEGGNESTLASITFSPGEGAATFTLADGQTFRLAFAR